MLFGEFEGAEAATGEFGAFDFVLVERDASAGFGAAGVGFADVVEESCPAEDEVGALGFLVNGLA